VNRERLQQLLQDVADGRTAPSDALDQLRTFPLERLPFAQIDHHRALHQGHPEVIFCEHKTVEQVVGIASRLATANGAFLGTRATAEQAKALVAAHAWAEWDPIGRTVYLPPDPEPQPSGGPVLIVAAGTSDLPVANEAATSARALGLEVERLTDVGVSGLHRILAEEQLLHEARVIIVVAGMEGALPSVVGGLVSSPVIAVPTSVGYGAAFSGLAALLGMLTACASGLTVVNIDNGFGAAVAAARICRTPAPTT
jgi:NCAIR mutase (PurE)-related protein